MCRCSLCTGGTRAQVLSSPSRYYLCAYVHTLTYTRAGSSLTRAYSPRTLNNSREMFRRPMSAVLAHLLFCYSRRTQRAGGIYFPPVVRYSPSCPEPQTAAPGPPLDEPRTTWKLVWADGESTEDRGRRARRTNRSDEDADGEPGLRSGCGDPGDRPRQGPRR